MPHQILKLLRCPSCRKKLSNKHTHLKCNSCYQEYKIHQGYVDLRHGDNDFISWVNQEMKYWEKEFINKNRQGAAMASRLDIRNEVFIKPLLLKKILSPGKIVLDIGSGDGYTVSYLCPPNKFGFTYIALDASKNALLKLKKSIPSAICIQAYMENLPFADKSFDVVFSLGALHHSQYQEKLIFPLKQITKAGGYLTLYEGTARKSALGYLLLRIGKFLTIESPHEERIDYAKLIKEIKQYYTIEVTQKEFTPFMTMCLLVLRVLTIRSDKVERLVMFFDKIVQSSVGKYFSTFDGSSVAVLGKLKSPSTRLQ